MTFANSRSCERSVLVDVTRQGSGCWNEFKIDVYAKSLSGLKVCWWTSLTASSFYFLTRLCNVALSSADENHCAGWKLQLSNFFFMPIDALWWNPAISRVGSGIFLFIYLFVYLLQFLCPVWIRFIACYISSSVLCYYGFSVNIDHCELFFPIGVQPLINFVTSILSLIVVDLGGPGVKCSPWDSRFAGSNPTENDGFFSGRKNPEHKFSGRNFKLGVPSLRFQAR